MTRTSAFAVTGIVLLAVCAAIAQIARAIARARVRRRQKMLHMCSIVTGSGTNGD